MKPTMTRLLISMCVAWISILPALAQSDSLRQSLLAKAALLHLQKKYKVAIPLYEKAFRLQSPNDLDAYKTAAVYSLDRRAEKAFEYLQLALMLGWRDANYLSFDPYFDFLKHEFPLKWNELWEKAFSLEEEYEKTLKYPFLRKDINKMALIDQQLRYKRIHSRSDSARRSIDEKILASDNENLKKAKSILKRYGWPKISDIGKDGQNNLWLIVQHSDTDIFFQKDALCGMEKLKSSGEINLENYAFLYDRVQCNLNYKQVYGTQVIWIHNGMASGFRAIFREDLVDERRQLLGLGPLKFYALSYGFNYENITTEKAIRNDLNDQNYCRNQIDSARSSLKKKNYEDVEKYFVNASVVLGGMTDSENYEAAVIFAAIAADTKQQKYKDLSLDFLNLLHLRGALKKSMLQEEPSFRALQREKRWIEISKSLNTE
jgi:hypothetical protein